MTARLLRSFGKRPVNTIGRVTQRVEHTRLRGEQEGQIEVMLRVEFDDGIEPSTRWLFAGEVEVLP